MTASLPLAGCRVVDVSHVLAGPFCAMLLGDMGAEVIKVEPPGGDQARRLGPSFLNGQSSIYLSANRNKQSLALDLKQPEGLEILLKLVDTADVFVESFRPGVAERLGLGYEALSSRNPRLIYCSVSGYGLQGPDMQRPATDMALQAYGGLMSVTGHPDRGPAKVGAFPADISAALMAFSSVLLALLERHQSGRGQHISISLLSAVMTLQTAGITDYLISGQLPERPGSKSPHAAPAQVFATADGHILVVAVNQRMWERICDVIGRPDLTTDPRFTDNESRLANSDALAGIIEEQLSQATTGEWVQKFSAAGVICSPVQNYEQLVNSPQVAANHLLWGLEHPAIGAYRTMGFPIRMSRVTPVEPSPPPLVGEHTEAILKRLGLDDGKIQDLLARGVVKSAGPRQQAL